MNTTWSQFLSLDLPGLLTALCAALSCAILGSILVVRRMSLLGDALSHAVLPGIVLAFLLTQSRATTPVLIGAAVSGVLCALCIDLLRRFGRIESGAAMGVVFSIFFALGVLLIEQAAARQVDLDADFIEHIAKEIASIARSLSLKADIDKEAMLLKISEYQESTTLSRESFIDKQRVVSSLLKSNIFENKERFRMLLKDINAMLEYTAFIFIRLEYLQNTILGLINIDQNKTIKIFTIVAVVFMPPTLIASIYGMNFKFMPELDWSFGYPLAILLIVGSSILTLLIFKRKKWL